MKYIRYRFECKPLKPTSEILISFLSEEGFESFVESESGIEAYIPVLLENRASVDKVVDSLDADISVLREEIAEENWNAVWESDYEPVVVDKIFRIRAPFHPEDRSFDYDILIKPQMSFGTGHHQTTRLMLKAMSMLDFSGKKVIDAGSGTGVLAIASEKMGAEDVLAYDIEDWAFHNTLENKALNESRVEVLKGGSEILKGKHSDIILANINKNVLLADMNRFSVALEHGGVLVLSGFFDTDSDDLQSAAERFGLKLVKSLFEDEWTCLTFQKDNYG